MKNALLKNGIKTALVVGGVCALIPTVYGQGIGLRTFERVLVPTERTVERGEKIYGEQCASCHGEDGRANTPQGRQLNVPSFRDQEQLQRGTGPVSIYNVVSKGLPDAEHPVFNNLYYQDQFAVAHYVRTLIPNPQPDPQELVEQARFEAQNGVCDESVREGVSDLVEPKGDEQIQQGKQLYDAQCVACHGATGRGDGPGAAALQPPPRNFAEPSDQWTNAPSPLAVFNTLTQGIEGTSMPAYGHLSEDERWALTHYVVQELTPDNVQQQSTPEEIDQVCRALSTPPRPPSIPVDQAMKALAQDASELRTVRLTQYGPVQLEPGANAERGEDLFAQNCASCHGAKGGGARNIGPFGSFPPYLYLTVGRLAPAAAGGTYQDFARRSFGGAHASLPDMSGAAQLQEQDWKDLQAFVASLEGQGSDTVQTRQPEPAPTEDGEAPAEENDATTTDQEAPAQQEPGDQP